jgi:ribosome-associated toxin RatA of RatAB toxin-antitoxin module
MTIESPGPELRIDESGCFTHRTVHTALIAAPLPDVVRRLRDIRDWPRHLPHVLDIDVRYDDGRYQEFVMVVASDASGEPLRIRLIRNCHDREIEFFQPEPPAFLDHHGGRWRFREEDGGCRVAITLVWNLREDVVGTTAEQVAPRLARHARLTLEAWQRVFGVGGADG